MINDFLLEYPRLFLLIQLVDIRHEVSAEDVEFNRGFAEAGVPMLVIANKSDKIKKARLPSRLAEIRRGLGLAEPPVAHSVSFNESLVPIWQCIRTGLESA